MLFLKIILYYEYILFCYYSKTKNKLLLYLKLLLISFKLFTNLIFLKS